jgi:hypothetical protein
MARKLLILFAIILLAATFFSVYQVIQASPAVPNPGHGTSELEGDADLNMNSNKVINVSTPTASSDAATKGYVDAASTGSACPDNYGNLCLNGGGLEFTYNSKTLHIDAFPRSTYVIGGGSTGAYFESQYGLAWQHCERIGARLPTLAEWQAACSALAGPSGNGMTTFGGSISDRWEWTATPHSSDHLKAMRAGNGSCSNSNDYNVNSQTTSSWFRCLR